MTLDEIALKHGTDKASSHHDYCRIYERYFGEFRDQPVNLLEIGVQFGLSMKTWAEFFSHGEIYGVDLIRDFESDDPRIHLSLGDQGSVDFWKTFAPGVSLDLVVDDGCHVDEPQRVTFESMWPRLKPGGWYALEDCQTWFDPAFNKAAWVPQWVGRIISAINLDGKQYHGKPNPEPDPQFTELEKTVESVTFHPGLMIVKKKP